MIKKKILYYIISAVAFVFILSSSYIALIMFGSVEISSASREFVITEGQGVKQITKLLEEDGIIKSGYWFRILVWFMNKQSRFIAGTFELPQSVSSFQLINLLTTEGKKEVRIIKILEGWDIEDISSRLQAQGFFGSDEFESKTGKLGVSGTLDEDFYFSLVPECDLLAYKPKGVSLEGYLFPDTYEVYADSFAEDVIRKTVSNFCLKVTPDILEEISNQGKNFYDVLIMASIIEAEVPNDEDRAIVSGIFWSRIYRGMPLQSCATLNYAISGTNPALTAEQLKIDSKYNTYMYKGLPPTPIGNPGLSSIRAAVYPVDTDYLYFLSTPEGETVFSKTLGEHNAAKQKYLK